MEGKILGGPVVEVGWVHSLPEVEPFKKRGDRGTDEFVCILAVTGGL